MAKDYDYDNDNNEDNENLIELIGIDDNNNEYEERVYADEKGRWLWIARSKTDIMNGNGEYIRLDESQRKDMLKLIAEIKRKNEKDIEYRIDNDIVTKEEYQEFQKAEREKLI